MQAQLIGELFIYKNNITPFLPLISQIFQVPSLETVPNLYKTKQKSNSLKENIQNYLKFLINEIYKKRNLIYE